MTRTLDDMRIEVNLVKFARDDLVIVVGKTILSWAFPGFIGRIKNCLQN